MVPDGEEWMNLRNILVDKYDQIRWWDCGTKELRDR